MEPASVQVLGSGEDALSAEELERGQLDASWRQVVQLDSVIAADTARSPERWEDILADALNGAPTFLPLSGDVAGHSVMRVQLLLDRARFSPGVIDGHWGKNTEKAVYWLQKREGLPATGVVDSVTFARLTELAGAPRQLVRERVLTEQDVAGPFVEMPDEIYEAHKLDCTCYESLAEKLGERFHVTPELPAKLNPGVNLNALAVRDRLLVPAVRDSGASAGGTVAELVVSVAGNYLHANDAGGRLLYHFPITLGSGYSPEGGTVYQVNSVNPDPWWHLQRRLLHVGDPNRPDVKIPPGPNNAVGNMGTDLSKALRNPRHRPAGDDRLYHLIGVRAADQLGCQLSRRQGRARHPGTIRGHPTRAAGAPEPQRVSSALEPKTLHHQKTMEARGANRWSGAALRGSGSGVDP